MAWVVDTCLLMDLVLADPVFKNRAATLLNEKSGEGLVICPPILVELAPALIGDMDDAEAFLKTVKVRFDEPWLRADTLAAFGGWHRYVARRRQDRIPRRPVADVLIGGFALRFDGLLTRNAGDFRATFPTLKILEP